MDEMKITEPGISGSSEAKGWSLPDTRDVLGLAVLVGVFFLHAVSADSSPRAYLFSPHFALELLGQTGLLLGPPLALWLGLRGMVLRGGGLIPLLSVALSFPLLALTLLGLVLGILS
jgi:hypothetical protein